MARLVTQVTVMAQLVAKVTMVTQLVTQVTVVVQLIIQVILGVQLVTHVAVMAQLSAEARLAGWWRVSQQDVTLYVMEGPSRLSCLVVPYRLPWQQLPSWELMAFPAAVMTAVRNGRQGPSLHVNSSLSMTQLTTQVSRFTAQLVTQVDQLYHF
jgi:hypothetical protein